MGKRCLRTCPNRTERDRLQIKCIFFVNTYTDQEDSKQKESVGSAQQATLCTEFFAWLKIPFSRNTNQNFILTKQTTKFASANFQKMFSLSFVILRIQKLVDKQCRSR